MSTKKEPVRAVITREGTLREEPYARLLEGRHAGKEMPMGWNLGQKFAVGTMGFATYESTANAGLWGFKPDAVQVVESCST